MPRKPKRRGRPHHNERFTGHRLLKGARVRETPSRVIVIGGELIFEAKTYEECWMHLRKLVDLKRVPFESCMSAMNIETSDYIITPPPQSPEIQERKKRGETDG